MSKESKKWIIKQGKGFTEGEYDRFNSMFFISDDAEDRFNAMYLHSDGISRMMACVMTDNGEIESGWFESEAEAQRAIDLYETLNENLT
jgi:hypothetical protein